MVFYCAFINQLLKLVHFITNGEIHEKNMAAGLIGLGLVGCATPAYNYQAIPKNISKRQLDQ